MFSNRRVLLGILVLLVGLLAFNYVSPFRVVTTSQAQETDYDYEEIIEHTFKVQPGQALILDSDLGSVSVHGGSGNEVVLTVIKGANDMSERKAKELFERFDLDFDQSSRGVLIEGDYEGRRRGRHGNRLHVEFEITVPTEFDVDVKTGGGSVTAEELRGEASLRTSGGSITALSIDGPLDVNTSGGSIKVEDIGGQARLHTSGGSITARNVDGWVDCNTSGGSITIDGADGNVKAHTSGGSIRLTEIHGTANAHTSGGSIKADLATAPDGPMELETSGGSVTLYLTANTSVDIDARASGGRVRTDMPVEVEGEIKRDRLRGEINGGGPMIKLRSSGGGIRILEHE
ncbi:MAG: DUF4097 domain-containing protein [Rhodothermales bacterium]